MKYLAIESSTNIAQVAYYDDGYCVQKSHSGSREHAKKLLPMIESCLHEGGGRLSQLDGIVMGRGPGSFTGLRVACSLAQGIAFAHELPVYPVSSLRTIAQRARMDGGEKLGVLALIDARMDQLYWAYYPAGSADAKEYLSNPGDVSIPQEPFIIAGSHYEPYNDHFPPGLLSEALMSKAYTPDTEAMIACVRDGQLTAVAAQDAVPVYIRDQVTHGVPNG